MFHTNRTSRRTRWLAGQTGVHVPYLDLLPASETVRYASAAIAMLVSVLFAAAGWALVSSWSAAGVDLLPRLALALGAGLAAGVVVWSVDRELISGDGHLGVRGIIGAVNALFVGEIVLLALFAPFVEDQLQLRMSEDYTAAVAVAEAEYDTVIAAIRESESDTRPPMPAFLITNRENAAEALQAVRELETQLAVLNELRTAEVTGRVVVGEDGQPLTSGRSGDTGLATESLDRQIADTEDALARAVAQLAASETRLTDSENAYAELVDQASGQVGRFNDDRLAAQAIRDETISNADEARDAPVGLLGRIDVFHHAVWSDAVLAIAVLAVHIAVLAAELSVVLWAVNDRRRNIRLYPRLVSHIDGASVRSLPQIAQAIIDGAAGQASYDQPNEMQAQTPAAQPTKPEIDLANNEKDPAPIKTRPHAPEAPRNKDAETEDPPEPIVPTHPATARRLKQILEPKPIDVTLLCPTPSVVGCDEPLRPKRLAVLAYLALNRSGSVDSVRQTFWPDSTSTSASSNTISALRKDLGEDNDGEPVLGGQGQSHLLLSPEVGSDWTRFCQLVNEVPIDEAPYDQIPFLVASLNLVSGPPAVSASGSADNWEWLRNESTGTGSVAMAIREAADQLIALARQTGETDLVDWAVRRAMLAGNSDYEPPSEPVLNGAATALEAAGG